MNLLKAITTVGGFTLLSRIFGFIRDILIANFLGAGAAADAFFVAFRFPNLFRRLFAEGAFAAAFVPIFSGQLENESREQAFAIAAEVRKYGALLFRGGAFKPRSSPYSFQGLGEAGLKILAEVREEFGSASSAPQSMEA